MTKQDAIGDLADGHSFWEVEHAQEVCKTLNVPFDKELVIHYEGQADANPTNDPLGLWLYEDKPLDGVNALHLSYYVAEKLGVNTEKNPMNGRGSQAQWNASEIHKLLAV